MTVDPKPVTRYPTWLGGILLPSLGGVSLGSFLGTTTSWLTLAALLIKHLTFCVYSTVT